MIVSSWSVMARCALMIGILALLGGGCESERDRVQQTEQMLAAAGFHPEPANTPEREAQLQSLPPHQLMAQPLKVGATGTTGYAYADPDNCHCVYVGDDKAYSQFQRLAFEKRIADERMRAALLEDDTAFDWPMWGPGFWGPGPVIVDHRR